MTFDSAKIGFTYSEIISTNICEHVSMEKTNLVHEKVVLEKKADRVGILGPYTKRELRKLLQSTISLFRSDQKDDTKLDSTLRESTGLSQVDLNKLKEGKLHEISDEAARVLDDLEVTRDAVRKEKKHITGKKDEKKKEGKDSVKSFKDLLRKKGLSESLIRALMENGLTDEYIRLLKALGFTDADIEQLMASWQSGFIESASILESEESCISAPSSSDDDLSPESLYLKFYLCKVLPRALREVASKKPYDPIEYLGHWLLHSKICEERERRRKDFEMDLMVEREKYRMANLGEEEMVPEPIQDEGEEDEEDWNSISYLYD